jgi:hypothetical protein
LNLGQLILDFTEELAVGRNFAEEAVALGDDRHFLELVIQPGLPLARRDEPHDGGTQEERPAHGSVFRTHGRTRFLTDCTPENVDWRFPVSVRYHSGVVPERRRVLVSERRAG